MIKGVDISEHNGHVNFDTLKANGVEFCVFREGYRKAIDSNFLDNVKRCKQAGLTVLGVYHFIYWNGATIKENAESTVANMKLAGLNTSDTWIFVDLEYDSWGAKAYGETCTKSRCSQIILEYIGYLKQLGCKHIGVYGNADYYINYFTDEVKAYPFWLADWDDKRSYDCVLWQYSATTKIGSITFDMNYIVDESILNSVSEDTHTDTKTEVTKMAHSRSAMVQQMQQWLAEGLNDSNNSHKKIVDIYNNYKPWTHQSTCRNVAMLTSWAWCACTCSAAAIATNNADICPLEISCYYMIEAAKKMGIWVETDTYAGVKPGDWVIYCWNPTTSGEITSGSDHVGCVESVSGNKATIIEGNANDGRMYRRTITIGNSVDTTIRGWITPKYDDNSTPVQTPSTPAQPSNTHDVSWTGYICKKTTPKLESRADAKSMTTVKSADVNDKIGVCYKENGFYLVRFDKSGTYGFVPVDCVSKTKVEIKTDTDTKKDCDCKCDNCTCNKSEQTTTSNRLEKATSSTKFTVTKTGSPNKAELSVGRVTSTDGLNVRTWACGDLCKSRGPLGYDNLVSICDSILDEAGTTWYYVYIADTKTYAFVCADYIEIV